MEITIKLYAMLSDHLPPNAERNVGTVSVAEGSSVDALVEQLRLPRELVHLVLVNGVYVPHEKLAETPLGSADTVAIWPPVAGG